MTSKLDNESSDTDFPNFDPYAFDVDYVPKVRSGLPTTVLEKIIAENNRLKK